MFQKVLRLHRTPSEDHLRLHSGTGGRRGHERAALFLPLSPAETPADWGQSHIGGNPDERRGHGSVHGPLRPSLCGGAGLCSHRSAYHTLENLRLHLQSKLEKQPLGAIQEKGVGVWKKMFIDDIESMELLLAHALPEGLSNLAVPVVVFAAMFLTDWKLGLLSLCSLPLGVLAMGHDVPLRHEQDGRLLTPPGRK